MIKTWLTSGLTLIVALAFSTDSVWAQYRDRGDLSMRLSSMQDDSGDRDNGDHENDDDGDDHEASSDYDGEFRYRGVGDFFNVREANVDVMQGQWGLDLNFGWQTGGGTGDDDFLIGTNIRYGVLDNLFVELKVLPLNIGDGGDQGNGELGFTTFWQFLEETSTTPAAATWVDLRLPSGHHSSGVDAKLNFALTKQICSPVRGHLNGYVETVNGNRGPEIDDRRSFQWGLGAGLDYIFSESTLATLNYLHRSSEFDHQSNAHLMQLGLVHEITESQAIKFAFDIGLDGRNESTDFGAQVQYAIAF